MTLPPAFQRLNLPDPDAARVEAVIVASGAQHSAHAGLAVLLSALGWFLSNLATSAARRVIAQGLCEAVVQAARVHDKPEGRG